MGSPRANVAHALLRAASPLLAMQGCNKDSEL
jgi:hypothetical protein